MKRKSAGPELPRLPRRPRFVPKKLWIPALALLLASAGRVEANRFLQHQFPRIGARHAAMGGGHVALPSGVSGAYWNPALLSWENGFEFALEGTYVGGLRLDTFEEQNQIRFHNRADFGLVGFLFSTEQRFDFALLEATRYEHDIRGSLFDTVANRTDGKTILDYDDRVSIHSAGLAVGYRSGQRHSFGLGLWIDRKKVFKRLDYITDCPSDEHISMDFVDKEGSTNDVALRLNGGAFWRASQRVDLAAAFTAPSNLKSTLDVRGLRACTDVHANSRVVSEKTPLVLQVGGLYRHSADWRFVADIAYQRWQVFDDHNSVGQVSVGAEWDCTPAVSLRGGAYTLFDPANFDGEEQYAENLRSVEQSGSLEEMNDLFLTVGVGYRFRPYLQLDASLENSAATSPGGGQTSSRLALRFRAEEQGSR